MTRVNFTSQSSNSAVPLVLRIALPLLAAIIAGYAIGVTENSVGVAAVLGSALAALLLFVFLLKDWTSGIYVLFTWLVLEDSLRKYTGALVQLYAVKDLILILIYVSYFLQRWSRRERLLNWRGSVVLGMSVFVLWGLLCSLISDEVEWISLALGLRMWFVYFPLLFLGIDFAQSSIRVRRLFAWWGVSAALVAMFGLLQVMFGNELLNPVEIEYDARLFIAKVSPAGLALVKPTSVFLASGRFGKYLMMSLCISLGILSYHLETNEQWRTGTRVGVTSLGLVLLMNFLSGARITVVIAPLVLFAFLVFLRFRFGGAFGGRNIPFGFGRIILTGLAVIIVVWGLWLLTSAVNPGFLSAALDFYTKTTVPYMGEHHELHVRDLGFAIRNFWLHGSGAGKASMGLGYFFDDPARLRLVETGYASLIVEFGIIGVVLWFWVGLGMVRSSLEAARAIRDTSFYGLAVAVILLQVLFLFALFYLGVAVYQDYLVNSHLWFFSGLVIGISRRVGQCTSLLLGTPHGRAK